MPQSKNNFTKIIFISIGLLLILTTIISITRISRERRGLVRREHEAVERWRTNIFVQFAEWNALEFKLPDSPQLSLLQRRRLELSVQNLLSFLGAGDYDTFAAMRFPLKQVEASRWDVSGISNLIKNLEIDPKIAQSPELVYRRFWEMVALNRADRDLSDYCIGCLEAIAPDSQILLHLALSDVPRIHEITQSTSDSGTYAYFASLQSYEPRIKQLKKPVITVIYTVTCRLKDVSVPVPLQAGFVWDSDNAVWLPLGLGAFLGGQNLPTIFW